MSVTWKNAGCFSLVCALVFVGQSFAGPAEDRLAEIESKLQAIQRQVKVLNENATPAVSHIKMPKTETICGEPVPLSDPEVSRRIEFEFLLIMQDRGQVALWMKRAQAVFPRMEKIFKEMNACSDLKYLALIESGLRPRALSRAKAKGYWQFINSTGKFFGLNTTSEWDQRSDFRRSTEAAVKYLTQLHGQFGAWDLAMAAYNTGQGRLAKEIAAQKVKSYWRLRLLREAERYVPKFVAAKMVMERLSEYGFDQRETLGWSRPNVDYVRVVLNRYQRLPLKGVADGGGLDYRRLGELNPELTAPILRGPLNVVIEVPKGKATVFRNWVKRTLKKVPSRRTVKKRLNPKVKRKKNKYRVYKVRLGDSLWRVAQKFGMTLSQIRKVNGLSKKSVIRVGDRLKVKRR